MYVAAGAATAGAGDGEAVGGGVELGGGLSVTRAPRRGAGRRALGSIGVISSSTHGRVAEAMQRPPLPLARGHGRSTRPTWGSAPAPTIGSPPASATDVPTLSPAHA